MRILHCHIENFGQLSSVDIFFHEGMNAFMRENGWGKSTLAAFIRVMFYGFEGEAKRDDIHNERRFYAPWNGQTFGGALTFAVGEKEYTVTRLFANKSKDDFFELRDEKTHLISHDYSENLGAELFAIDSAAFQKTAFVSQEDCEAEINASVNAKISGITQIDQDLKNYDAADERLKDYLSKNSMTRATGSIAKRAEEINSLKAAVLGREALENRLAHENGNIAGIRKEMEAVQRKTEECRELQERIGRAAERRHIQERYQQLSGRTEETARALQEAETGVQILKRETKENFANRLPGVTYQEARQKCEELIGTQPERNRLEAVITELRERVKKTEREEIIEDQNKKRKRKHVLLTLAILFVVLAAGLFLAYLLFRQPLWIGSIVLLFAGIVTVILAFQKSRDYEPSLELRELSSSLQKKEEDYEGKCRELNDFLTHYQGEEKEEEKALLMLQKELEEYRLKLMLVREKEGQTEEKRAAFEKAKEELTAYLQTVKEDDLKAELVADLPTAEEAAQLMTGLLKKMEELRREKSRIERTVEELSEDLEHIYTQEERLKQLEEEQEEEKQKYEIVNLTRELLSKAKENLYNRYQMPIVGAFQKYMKLLRTGREERYLMDADGTLFTKEGGRQRDLKVLSAGEQDLTGIAMRLALLDAMYPAEKPPVIFDDPFTNCDEERLKGAFSLLETVSSEYQLIYFTCHPDRMPEEEGKED